MSELPLEGPGGFSVKPLRPEMAELLRKVTTFFDLHESCSFKVCRRAKACATRHVLCYQAREQELKPIVRSAVARRWAIGRALGDEIDVPPAREAGMLRLLEWEEREIAKVEAGEYGNEELSTYQLWLLNLAREEPPSSAAVAEGDLWPALTRPSRTGAPSSSEASPPAATQSMETPAGSANRESVASPGRRRRPGGIAARPRR